MTTPERSLGPLAAALGLAPFQSDQWMTALELLASATNSGHAELIGWNRPNKAPFKLISNLSDSGAKLIRDWDEYVGADPTQNPIIARGVRTEVLEIVSDDEIISRDDRRRHRVWNEFYDKLGTPHLCFTSLWRDGEYTQLGLFLLRSQREGPVEAEQRRIFAAAAYHWYNAATLSRAIKDEGTRVLTGAFEKLSIAAVVLDGFGRCINLSPAAEALVRDGHLFRIRMGDVGLAKDAVGKANCALGSRTIQVDSALQPCVNCLVKSGVARRGRCQQSCSIRVDGPQRRAASLRLSPLPRSDYDIGFGAAAIIVIEPAGEARRIELAPEIAAMLTPAECEVALDLLNGQRPAEIAARRRVSIETVRSQIKRIYAKAEVAGAIEFVARARR